ncbi:MAG: hypothetical protein ACAH59_00565 [Pseudobdellovibrionaceae bacterium]
MDYREGKKLADEARELALRLMAQEKLSREEESQMMTAAQALVFISSRVATPLQMARAHWLASRVSCRLNEARFAVLHAQLCDFHTKQSNERNDSDTAYAIEALARASACKGDQENAKRLYMEAFQLGQKIRDSLERDQFQQQFQAQPWFGLEIFS